MNASWKIKGKFIPTKKNKPAENFYSDCSFKKEGDYWVFNTDQVMKKPEQIKLRNNTNWCKILNISNLVIPIR